MSLSGIILPSLQVQVDDQRYTLVTPHSVWEGTQVLGTLTSDNLFYIEQILSAPPIHTVAMIILFTKRKYGVNAKRIPYYLSKPLNGIYPHCKVTSTYGSKHGTSTNLYAKIQITAPVLQSEIAMGEIVQLFGTIDNYLASSQAILHHYVTLRPRQLSLSLKSTVDTNFAHYAFTIDPQGCSDVDDAISFDICENQRVKIGIHITDIVSLIQKYPEYIQYYYQQPFTIYSPAKTIHSLPEELSCQEGSLLANGDSKPVLSLYINMYRDEINYIHLVRNTIQVQENLSYEQANTYIQDKKEWSDFFQIICKLISKDTIQIMSQEPSHMIIDYLMVFFNRWIAEQLVATHSPNILLRVHEEATSSTYLDPEVSSYVYTSRDSKAYYYLYNHGDSIHRHEGLMLNYYTHFTSPLRRYPDFIVHTHVYKYLFHQEISFQELDVNYINQFEKRIKKMERIWKWSKFLYSLENATYEVDCYVVDWYCHHSLKIELYFPEWKSCLTSKLIDKQVLHHYLVNFEDKQKLQINDIQITRYQKLHVNIWWDYTKGFKGTRIQFLSPTFPFP